MFIIIIIIVIIISSTCSSDFTRTDRAYRNIIC